MDIRLLCQYLLDSLCTRKDNFFATMNFHDQISRSSLMESLISYAYPEFPKIFIFNQFTLNSDVKCVYTKTISSIRIFEKINKSVPRKVCYNINVNIDNVIIETMRLESKSSNFLNLWAYPNIKVSFPSHLKATYLGWLLHRLMMIQDIITLKLEFVFVKDDFGKIFRISNDCQKRKWSKIDVYSLK